MIKRIKRFNILMIIVSLCFSTLIIRLSVIKVSSREKYYHLAQDLWTRSSPVMGLRGVIYDRNGKKIISNCPKRTIVYIPKQIKDVKKTSKLLSEIIKVDEQQLIKTLSKNKSIDYLKGGGMKIDEDIALKVLKLNLPGIYLVPDFKREYLYDDLLAHSLGIVGAYNQGLTGIELKYEKYLQGTNGAINNYTDAHGNKMNNLSSFYQESIPGSDIYLTIDLNIQQDLKRIINNCVDKYNPEDMMMIAYHIKTGEILGMESYPSFDPFNYQTYDDEVINRNLPIFKVFEPGSTGKILTFATGLELKKFTIDETFIDPGFAIVDGIRIKDWKKGGHGRQTFLQVLENSCNPGFVNLGLRIGASDLFKYFNLFGLGQKTGIDLNGEAKGILFDPKNIKNIELATSSFGQGNAVTGIQLVSATSAVVNLGNLMRPYIVKKIVNNDEIVFENKPFIRRKVISDNTSLIMRYALECVTAHGTGRSGYLAGYRVGGKTGTAQVSENGRYVSGKYILSYIGFAPMDDPEICIYVAITNPKNCVQYGGVVCGPLVKEALMGALTSLNIPKRNTQVEFLPRYYIDDKVYKVPNFIGKTHQEALKMTSYFSFIKEGSGNKIIAQVPEGGDDLTEGGTIILYMG